ncbi:AAA family ATPase [Variovorax sp. RCC_210]|uniref:AAA family ATPase n=1 Tax=Variovorax sp. RCC_210 TaxID=3239217 RepID=UPI003525C232
MQLIKLRIQNLRSIVDTGEFSVGKIFSLVGENNTGKSNLLRAIEILLTAGAAKLTPSDFRDGNQSIVIKGVFGNLTKGDKNHWRAYLIENELHLEKRLSIVDDERTGRKRIDTEYHGYRAEATPFFLSLAKISTAFGERPKWAEIVKENNLPDYFLDPEGKVNKAGYSKALTRYLSENEIPYDPPDLSQTQALGLQSNVISSLPKVYLLPAITNYADEIDKRSSTSTFRRLMGALSERLLNQDPRFNELQAAIQTIRDLLNSSKKDGALARISSLGTIEESVAKLLKRVMPSVQGVALTVEIEEFKDLFSAGVSMSVHDGVMTDVVAKGHGLQRCIIFTLLQSLIFNDRNLVADEIKSEDHESIILLVEEPELYIHPQLSKLFSDVLVSFSESDQIIYTTHSPIFVDAYEAERVAIVSKTELSGTTIRCCDKSAFEGLGEKKLFQGFTRLTSAMNELFFARRVLLVEGPEDVVAVVATLQATGQIAVRPEELEWSVVSCGGKEAIPFFQRIANAFSIPYAVLHDLDITEDMPRDQKAIHTRSNSDIAALAKESPVYTYPVKLESSLGITHHLKDMYSTHRYFSTPENISTEVREIITAIFRN